MAEVDTSFYPKAENNLMQSLGAAAQFRNINEQNKLLQLQQQQGQVGLDQSKIDLAHRQFGFLSQTLGSLAQDPRIGTAEGPQILQQTTQQLVKQGIITPDVANVELQNMPQDPTQLPQYLRNLNTRVLDAQQQFGAIYGTPSTIATGNRAIPVTASPITGIRRIGADIPMETTPSERGALVNTTAPNGQTVTTTAGNVMQAAGVNPLTAMPDTSSSNAANQLIPAQGSGTATSAPLPPAQQPQGPAGGVVTSPPAGTVEGLQNAAKVSSEKYAQDSARETNFQSNMTPMLQAYKGVVELGKTGMGPGSDEINQIRSFAVSMGIPIDPNSTNVTDEVDKYLTQMARQNGYTGSDAQLDAAQKASPTLKTSQGAATKVLQKMIALSRMNNAQVRSFDASGQNPADYSKWATDWNSKQNAAAYAFDLMAPEDRLAYIKTLSPEKLTQFKSSLTNAVRLGLIEPPSAGQQAQ